MGRARSPWLPRCENANDLVDSAENVRKTAGAESSLQELAASIGAHGLLQSLVVRKAKKGKFAVVARRTAAICLAAAGRCRQDRGRLRCAVPGAGQRHVSLADNSVREPMHPADEFDAFRSLVDGGMSEADVAARFGVTGSAFGWSSFLKFVSREVFSSGRLLLSIPLVQLCAAHKPKKRAVLASAPSGSAPLRRLTAPPSANSSPIMKRMFCIGL